MTRIPLGAYIWIRTIGDIDVIKRFEERTATHLVCDRGKPIPLSNIKSVKIARGELMEMRQAADEWEAGNRHAVIPNR